uniref:Amino acid transporters n=1 Tax=mine drainage metagenome TaxID=410659 RepID=E6QN65_9ZZZZ
MGTTKTTHAPMSDRVRLVVASSVMLTFISFWRASAIVLCDLGSSAFYAGGIAEGAVGRSAPWFILGIMLFSFAVRAVYVESCTMFTRGGVYRIVKEALGGTFAKISVSALMFDYILTGPISGVSAGQYIVGLMNELLVVSASHGWLPAAMLNAHGQTSFQFPINETSAFFAAIVTIYYWWENIKGIEESSDKALKTMQITTVMVVIILAWGIYSAIVQHASLPPFPSTTDIQFSDYAKGFLKGTGYMHVLGLFGILMAFGHSVLAMSGEESLAQVNREIEYPKLKNLKRAALVIALYSLIFTGGATMLASMLIPDGPRTLLYQNNLIAGLAMYMTGPTMLKIGLRIFVVIVGFLILSGAINTSFVGSTGVLMRMAEDGVLTDWFRKPHVKFGTSFRIINMVFVLQMFTILITRGDVDMLGEAYAFGVIWSFAFMGIAMLVLRWKFKGHREWKVPGNIRIGKIELPVGLASVTMVLISIAMVNLATKRVATISGVIFTAIFFVVFYFAEKQNHKNHAASVNQMKEHFQLEREERISRESLGIRPGGVMVTMRDAANPFALKWALSHTSTDEQDIVVLTARIMGAGGPEYLGPEDQIFSEHEQMVFTKAISVAESFGKTVSLVVVPAGDIFAALVQTAHSLEVDSVISGLSTKMTPEEQAFHIGQAWEVLPEPKNQMTFYVISANGDARVFHLGPHAPNLRPDDVQLVHRLWLNLRRDPVMRDLHHSDVITYSLTRLASQYARDSQDVVKDIERFKSTAESTSLRIRKPEIAIGPGSPEATPASNSDHDSH